MLPCHVTQVLDCSTTLKRTPAPNSAHQSTSPRNVAPNGMCPIKSAGQMEQAPVKLFIGYEFAMQQWGVLDTAGYLILAIQRQLF